MLSCKDKTLINIDNPATSTHAFEIRDTSHINVTLPSKQEIHLMNHHDYLSSESIIFVNNKDSISTLNRLLEVNEYHLLEYFLVQSINGKFSQRSYNFLLDPKIDTVKLSFDAFGKLTNSSPKHISDVDSLFTNYRNWKRNKDNAYEVVSFLNESREKNKRLFESDTIINLINDIKYYSCLAEANLEKPNVWKFFTEYNDTIIGGGISRQLKFLMAKNYGKNIDSLLTNSNLNYSVDLKRKFSEGSTAFLSIKENRSKQEYAELIKWLESTEFYNSNKNVKKLLEPLANKKFKETLAKIKFTDSPNQNFDGLPVTPKTIYLIDFWATWCAPCIEGIKTMKEMEMPENLQVISISLDKDKDHEKWEKMTKALGQEVSFRMSDTVKANQEFLKFIELESLPRYILMDKDFNLIDQAFYHPQEPQFLPKLKDLKNYKRW